MRCRLAGGGSHGDHEQQHSANEEGLHITPQGRINREMACKVIFRR
ncbi:hypothetical protein AWT69_001215 [Pseudomonas putida]|nr:hypothetical protein AWT69_001215 [Pseudomonas putida]